MSNLEEKYEYSKALKYFQKQYSILEELGYEQKSDLALKNISRTYVKLNKSSESISALEDANTAMP